MRKENIILFYPGYEGMGKYHWFPFPYLYLTPFLKKAGYDPVIIDARVELGWKVMLKKALKKEACMGITAMTGSDITSAIEAAKICRAVNKSIPIVWGGPHASAMPEEVIFSSYADIVVSGPGEEVFVAILKRLETREDVSVLPGVSVKGANGNALSSDVRYLPFNYDIFPAFDSIDVEKYRSPNNVASMFTARGCPYHCTFCTTHDKGYSERTLEQVKDEIIRLVRELKFRNIFFQDGTFMVRKKRVMEIADMIVKEGLNIKWKAKARVNSLLDYSAKEMTLLKKSGLVSLFFGVESGSQRILDLMRKETMPEDAEKSAAICSKHGIEFYGSFMFAVPRETANDLRETITYIRKLKAINPNVIIQNCIYLPLPGTPMYDDVCSLGYVPPSGLKEWAGRSISSRFEERHDIAWIPKSELKRYIEIYNKEFGEYKHLFERERSGAYKSVFAGKKKIN